LEVTTRSAQLMNFHNRSGPYKFMNKMLCWFYVEKINVKEAY
jgi:hypothetical protein